MFSFTEVILRDEVAIEEPIGIQWKTRRVLKPRHVCIASFQIAFDVRVFPDSALLCVRNIENYRVGREGGV